MGNCKDCKWWQKYPEREFGKCKELAKDVDEHDDLLAWMLGEHRLLLTRPNFGCVLFEQREQNMG
jgi:hypothetical protein